VVSYGLLYAGVWFLMGEMDPLKKQKLEAKKSKARLLKKLAANNRAGFEMNDYESIVSGDVVYPEDLDVGFGDIGGLESVKEEVFDIVALPLRRPDLFRSGSRLLRPPKGILLYGPPGTGKTMMAKAIARESGAAFINLQMSTTMNKWFGESQKLVRATFSLAWKLSPCIVFIDEIDSFLRERSSDENSAQGNMKAEFMSLWDGMGGFEGDGYGVIVVGATNRPWDVDPAILRRMPRAFKMDLPGADERLSILRLFLENERLDADLDLGELAVLLEGYSGSDIKELCQTAAMRPFREFARVCRALDDVNVSPDKMRAISRGDFVSGMEHVKATGQAAYEYQDATQQQQQQQMPQLDVLLSMMSQLNRESRD